MKPLRWLITGAALTTLWCGLPTKTDAAPPLVLREVGAPAPTRAESPGWATQVSAGYVHTCAVTVAGAVECWGSNGGGEVGDGTTRDRGAPVAVVGLTEKAVMVNTGARHACALTGAGGVKCWGVNNNGQLGDGTTTSRPTAADVAGLTQGVQAISLGYRHTCALTNTGGVKCWGDNTYGQLGDGTTATRLTPVDVLGLSSGVRALSAGNAHTCALTDAGTIQCWGYNGGGALGDGTQSNRLVPVAVVGLAEAAVALGAGSGHTCAVLTGGGAQCWGSNDFGQLGDGTMASRLTPAPVLGLAGKTLAVSSGNAYTCALGETGRVQCWGLNASGALGDGTTTSRTTPVVVQGLAAEVKEVSAGGEHACAVLTAGGIRCWGMNPGGALGDGTTAQRLTPVDVWHLEDYDCTAVTEIPTSECQALVTFFKATNGPLWREHTGWLRTATPCSWQGVACDADHVGALVVPANNLVDTLPAALGNLTALQTLDLNGNAITGALPAIYGSLSALQTLDLHGNALAGPLPASLSLLDTLRTLDLSHNQLRDSIPFHLADLKQLTYLDLSHNNLTGSLPFGYLVDPPSPLQYLDLSHNQFNGDFDFASNTIPAVTHLDLSHNALFWEIPRQLGGLTALTYLDLHANRFSGVIQPDLGNLHALTYLDLGANHLTYNIPAELGGVGSAITTTTAITISLAGNHLLDGIPAALGGIAGLRSLDLSGNQLSGVVPAAVAEHPFATLNLNYNQLAPTDPRWRDTQTVAPTDLRAVADGATVLLTWTPLPYEALGPYEVVYATYEISYATDPGGPFTVAGRTTDNGAASYTVTGLAPATVYYFRVRTFTPAHPYWGSDGEIVYQPNNLWSDYTPLVSVNVAATPRVFLPLVGRVTDDGQ